MLNLALYLDQVTNLHHSLRIGVTSVARLRRMLQEPQRTRGIGDVVQNDAAPVRRACCNVHWKPELGMPY